MVLPQIFRISTVFSDQHYLSSFQLIRREFRVTKIGNLLLATRTMSPVTRTILFLLQGVSLDRRMAVIEGISGQELRQLLFDTIVQLTRPQAIRALAQLLGDESNSNPNVSQQAEECTVRNGRDNEPTALSYQGTLASFHQATLLPPIRAISLSPDQQILAPPHEAAMPSRVPNALKRPIAKVQTPPAADQPKQLNGLPYPDDLRPAKQAKVHTSLAQEPSSSGRGPQDTNNMSVLNPRSIKRPARSTMGKWPQGENSSSNGPIRFVAPTAQMIPMPEIRSHTPTLTQVNSNLKQCPTPRPSPSTTVLGCPMPCPTIPVRHEEVITIIDDDDDLPERCNDFGALIVDMESTKKKALDRVERSLSSTGANIYENIKPGVGVPAENDEMHTVAETTESSTQENETYPIDELISSPETVYDLVGSSERASSCALSINLINQDEEQAPGPRIMHDLAELIERDSSLAPSLELVYPLAADSEHESEPETEPPSDFEPWSDSDVSSVDFEGEFENEVEVELENEVESELQDEDDVQDPKPSYARSCVKLDILHPHPIEWSLFIPTNNGSDGHFEPLSALPPLIRAKLMFRFINAYRTEGIKTRNLGYARYVRDVNRQKYADNGSCLGNIVYRNVRQGKVSYTKAKGNKQRSCDVCVRLGRLCARMVKAGEDEEYKLGIYPLPETFRKGKKWDEVEFWVR
jgi:hypothetical protein